MAREVPEWVGQSDDQTIPLRVKLRLFERAEGRCQECTKKLMAGELPQYDHIVALINGGEHRESNLRMLCVGCHKGKTKLDVAEKSKVSRIRKRFLGFKKPRTITRWRRFNGTIRVVPRDR